ncbi:unnamed protein product [Schistosoma mattheei]|uniref:Uncharacterized protein n=1 Tax=Schistosoma mattheei TaxID=31246 RepID=A0A183PFA5_9TREM|nr:unnamed protein product [Schistosoma mattheei]
MTSNEILFMTRQLDALASELMFTPGLKPNTARFKNHRLAAILSDEPNSFYCTRDTPLINEIFGEYVNEQIVQSHTSSCDTYEKLCAKCLNRMTENSKCNSKYMNMNEFSGKCT